MKLYNHFTRKGWVVLEPIPTNTGQEAGYILDKSPAHHQFLNLHVLWEEVGELGGNPCRCRENIHTELGTESKIFLL